MLNSNTDAKLTVSSELLGRLLSSDPQRVGSLYLIGVTASFLVGALIAGLLRFELLQAQPALLNPDLYGRLLSTHGVFMLFLVALPLFPGVLGNLLLPSTLGLRQVALPRLNMAGAVLYLAGICLLLPAALRGGIDSTWMLRPELSIPGREGGLLLMLGILAVALALVCLSLNLLVTLGLRVRRGQSMSYFGWSLLAASASLLLAIPVLLALLALRLADILFGIPFFESAAGSDPTVYRRLFLYFSRPAFYAAALPALGLVTDLLERHFRGRCFSPRGVRASFFMLAILAHLGAVGSFTAAGFSRADLFSALVGTLSAVPGLLILGNWLTCLRSGTRLFAPPVLFAGGFVLLGLLGGLSGLIAGSPALGVHIHGTLFSVAHIHFLLAGALVMAYLGGIHWWWESATGESCPVEWSAAAAVLILVGTVLTFGPQFFLGWFGVPRRLAAYPGEFQVWQVLSSAGATLLLLGYLLPLLYLTRGLFLLRRSDRLSRMEAPTT